MWNYGYYLEANKRKTFSIPERNSVKAYDFIRSKKILNDLYESGSLSGNVKQITPFFPSTVFSKNYKKNHKSSWKTFYTTRSNDRLCSIDFTFN